MEKYTVISKIIFDGMLKIHIPTIKESKKNPTNYQLYEEIQIKPRLINCKKETVIFAPHFKAFTHICVLLIETRRNQIHTDI